MALRKVDIVSWESEAARQARREIGLDAIPRVLVHGASGNLLADVKGANFGAIEAAVAKEGK